MIKVEETSFYEWQKKFLTHENGFHCPLSGHDHGYITVASHSV